MTPITKRIETLTEIPSEKVGDVIQDFKDVGGEVSVSTQPNGRFAVQAVFVDRAGSTKVASSGVLSGSR
jgi:hypothetical protein